VANVQRNIVANMLGKGVSAVLIFLFVPIYVRYLGPEAYGVVGLFATMQAIFFLADAGLSAAFTREAARLSAFPGKAAELRDTGRSFEVIFQGIGLGVAVLVASSASLIANHWVQTDQLPPRIVSTAIQLMGISIGLQLPTMVYSGGLTGLQRQTTLNLLTAGMGLLRGLGSVILLRFAAPSIVVFFIWQAVVGLIQMVVSRQILWRIISADTARGTYRFSLIRPLWRFAAGMAGISMVSVVFTQMDKLILSKMLSLQQFGYYSLASTAASAPFLLAAPVFSAIYPSFTQLMTAGDFPGLAKLYHASSQLTAIITIPIGLVLAVFAPNIMFLWTHDTVTSEAATPLVSMLVAGSVMQGLLYVPYALQLADGWTKLALQVSVVSIAFLVPSLIWLIFHFGAMGAAAAWVVFNLFYMLSSVHLMHRRLLPDAEREWYLRDIGGPLLATLPVIGVARLLLATPRGPFVTTTALAVTLCCAIAAATLGASRLRGMLQIWWAAR
jgi:O-antigen/teichoic acid export membrane protein